VARIASDESHELVDIYHRRLKRHEQFAVSRVVILTTHGTANSDNAILSTSLQSLSCKVAGEL
jgi:hypothetical protein